MVRIVFVFLVAIVIAGCSGSGNGNSGSNNFSRPLHLGPGTAPSLASLDAVTTHDDVSISYGQAPDQSALSTSYLISYLRADADNDYDSTGGPGVGVIRRFDTPPVVRVAEGASAELIQQVSNVIHAINAALPNDWQLTFSRTPAPVQADHNIEAPDGEIHVHFSSRTEWPSVIQDTGASGFAPSYLICLDVFAK